MAKEFAHYTLICVGQKSDASLNHPVFLFSAQNFLSSLKFPFNKKWQKTKEMINISI